MPQVVTVMDKIAIGTVAIWSSVLAKRMAVPDTVAMASDKRNHATRKMTVCRNLIAILIVFHTEDQAKKTYAKT